MKTFIAPLIMIGSTALLAGLPDQLNAQDMLMETSAATAMNCAGAADGSALAAAPSVTDFVNAEFTPVPYNGDALLRTSTPLCNGSFRVRVVDANGTLRMTGTFSDGRLVHANGLFTYFHDNSFVESVGTFSDGTKSGTWERYSPDGRRLADREYRGLDVDGLLELNGLTAYARTLN
ncbi:MAG: hypothetical protein ABI599_18010 [Flavobacteriales bacterium]